MEFRSHTLDNGLEVVAECSDKAYSMALAFFVNTGSRDESAEVAGVSHFLEHMVFKGTPNRTAAEVNRELDEIGSQSNAYTTEEHTVYYAAVLPDYQEDALDLLADILRPSLRQDDFDTEKKVIIEEIHKYDDQPPFGAHEACMSRYFGRHPLGNSVLGTVDSVSALTRDAMVDYFEQRYSPGNIKLVATGRVDFDALVVAAEKRCGDWLPFEVARDISVADEWTSSEPLYITRDNAAQQYVVQISSAPAAESPLRYAQHLMSIVFGDESGSRLFWRLVDSGLAEYAVTGTSEFQGSGITMAFLSCAPEDTEDNVRLLLELQQELESDGVTEAELELAKSKLCSQIVRRAERPSNRLFAVGNHWLQLRQYITTKQTVEAFQQVTDEDVASVLKSHSLSRHATVLAGPLSANGKVAEEGITRSKRTVDESKNEESG